MKSQVFRLLLVSGFLFLSACEVHSDSKNANGNCSESFIQDYNRVTSHQSYASEDLIIASCYNFISKHGSTMSCKAQSLITGGRTKAHAAEIVEMCDPYLSRPKSKPFENSTQKLLTQKGVDSRGHCTTDFITNYNGVTQAVREASAKVSLNSAHSEASVKQAHQACKSFYSEYAGTECQALATMTEQLIQLRSSSLDQACASIRTATHSLSK